MLDSRVRGIWTVHIGVLGVYSAYNIMACPLYSSCEAIEMVLHIVMRKRRLIGKPGSSYHVISRFVDRQFALGSNEAKAVFLQILVQQAAFSGVEILTFCLMGNHFHLLVRVPDAPELPEQEVLRRIGKIWNPKRLDKLKDTLAEYREMSVEGEILVARELDRFRRRMFNLSEFVKDIKQNFTTWFNKANERKGTLFEERFKSVLVQSGRALRFMAAYIELNPVRAGIVDDPVDYPWCGYAQAVASNQDRRRGIQAILADPRDQRNPNHPERRAKEKWPAVAKRYRRWLFERGAAQHNPDGTLKKPGFSRADAIAAWRSDPGHPDPPLNKTPGKTSPDKSLGKSSKHLDIPPAKLLRCKARYFTDSLIYGDEKFVSQYIDALQTLIATKFPKAHNTPNGLCSLIKLRGKRVE